MKLFSSLVILPSFVSSALSQGIAGCDVSKAIIQLPPDQTILQVPTTQPNSIALGVGFQNYTCTPDGNYTSIGAFAEFFDISCLLEASPLTFKVIQDIIFPVWNASDPPTSSVADLAVFVLGIETLLTPDVFLGTHFFQLNPFGSGINPVFDYRTVSREDDPNAFVLAKVNGSLPAPTGPHDVAWLSLAGVQGDLGQTVMRVNTVAGQPPSHCTPGSGNISVKYSAQYWFFGGPPSPLLNSTSTSSSYSSPPPSTSYVGKYAGSKNLAEDAALGQNDDSQSLSDFDPNSKAFPFMVALVAINGLFVIGVLVAIFFHLFRPKRQTIYTPTGERSAPQGMLEEIEREFGPYHPEFKDPYDESAPLKPKL